MLTISNVVLVVTTTTTGLISGLLYAFSCSVSPGLGRLSDEAYVLAMQSINKSIQNPLFFISFLGTFLLLPISAYLHYAQPFSTRFLCLFTAGFIYVVGVVGVTVFGNIPLNDTLSTLKTSSASPEEFAIQRARFEGPWNKLNFIRTLAAILAFIFTVIACVSPGKILLTE